MKEKREKEKERFWAERAEPSSLKGHCGRIHWCVLGAEVSDGAAESALRGSILGAVRERSWNSHALIVSDVSIAKIEPRMG